MYYSLFQKKKSNIITFFRKGLQPMNMHLNQSYHKPVKTFPSRGGYRAFGFTLKNGRKHNGEDYWCSVGSPVCAILDGEVVLSSEIGGFGSLNPSTKGGCIIIKHRLILPAIKQISDSATGTFFAIYGHLTRKVEKGNKVNKGQVVGLIRPFTNEGISCPHLHFGINTFRTHPVKGLGYSESLIGFHNPKQYMDRNAFLSGMQSNGYWAPTW